MPHTFQVHSFYETRTDTLSPTPFKFGYRTREIVCVLRMACIFFRIFQWGVTYLLVLLVVVRQHQIGSQVLTLCPPLRNVSRVQAVTESRPSREIDDVLQITIKFTLEANYRTRVNTSYVLGHGIGKAYCSPYIGM